MPTLSKLAEGEVLSTARPADLPLDELSSKPSPQPSENEAKPPVGAAADLTAALVPESGTLVSVKVKISPNIIARSAGAKLALDTTTSDAPVKEGTPKPLQASLHLMQINVCGACSLPTPVTPSNIAVEGTKPKRVNATVAKPRRDMALGLKVGSFNGPSGLEVRIDRILPGSTFEKTALEEGLIIESINGERYDSFLDCIALFKQAVGEVTVVAVAPTNEAQAPGGAAVAAAVKDGAQDVAAASDVGISLDAQTAPVAPPTRKKRKPQKEFTVQQKLDILSELEAGAASVPALAEKHKISRTSIYRWKKDQERLLKLNKDGKGQSKRVSNKRTMEAPKPAFQANASAIITRPYFEETMPPSMLLPALHHLAKQESDATLVVAAKKALAGGKKKQLARLQEEVQSKPATDRMASGA